MKNPKFSVLVTLLTLVATVLLIQPSMSAQQEPSSSSPTAQQTQQPDPASRPASMSQASDSQTFTGKVAKSGSKLVLQDSATKATYALDDQDTAKRFEGQAVKVTGTLDPKTNTIRVANIEPGS